MGKWPLREIREPWDWLVGGGETHSIEIETWDHGLCYWEVSNPHIWNYCPLMVLLANSCWKVKLWIGSCWVEIRDCWFWVGTCLGLLSITGDQYRPGFWSLRLLWSITGKPFLWGVLHLAFVLKEYEHMSHFGLPFLFQIPRLGCLVLKHKHWLFSIIGVYSVL